MGAQETVYDTLDPGITSVFTGYETTEDTGKILILTTKVDEEHYGETVPALAEGDEGSLIADRTPFYATKGGQAGDHGIIRTEEGTFEVTDTIPLRGGRIAHIGTVTDGVIRAGGTASFTVSRARFDTMKNHSATHLLQKALRTVLGDHVEQKGSYVDPQRLRFDFVHFKPMTAEEIAETERIVNEEIRASLPVVTKIMSLEDAKKTGAMALFGEKYGDEVRVVSMGDFSVELCGGTHVRSTSEIGLFKILSESGIAAGVRRIEALTGDGVTAYYRSVEETLRKAGAVLKSAPAEVPEKAEKLLAEIRSLHGEIEALKSKIAHSALSEKSGESENVSGVTVLCARIDGTDMNGLRNLSDELRAKYGESFIVLLSEKDGRVNIVAAATDGAVAKGAHAGNLIRKIAGIVGGGGGGRPQMAQAGGKDPSKIAEAVEEARKEAVSQLQS